MHIQKVNNNKCNRLSIWVIYNGVVANLIIRFTCGSSEKFLHFPLIEKFACFHRNMLAFSMEKNTENDNNNS